MFDPRFHSSCKSYALAGLWSWATLWHSTNRGPSLCWRLWLVSNKPGPAGPLCFRQVRGPPPTPPTPPAPCSQSPVSSSLAFWRLLTLLFSLAYFLQSALESELSQLFKHLHGTRQTLSLILAPHQEPDSPAVHTPPTAVYARLLNQSHHCCAILDRCCLDLLTLSLIVPSAPWVSRPPPCSLLWLSWYPSFVVPLLAQSFSMF